MSQLSWFATWIIAATAGMLAWGPCFAAPPKARQEIQWTEDLDAAIAQARDTNTPLMLHFYGDHCPPCRMLDAKAFRDRGLIDTLNSNVIAVRINADRQRNIAQRYNVQRWPTDVFLFSNGDEISRGVSNQDPMAYSKIVERACVRQRDWTLEQVAMREAKERRVSSTGRGSSSVKTRLTANLPESGPPVRVRSSTWSQPSEQRSVSNPYATDLSVGPELASAPASPKTQSLAKVPNVSDRSTASEVVTEVIPEEDRRAEQLALLSAVPGLGGYCPVTLQESIGRTRAGQPAGQAWTSGREQFSVRHRGRIYRCASEESRQQLLKDPDRFTPVLSGCDLVEFARNGNLINGNCEFGFIEQKTGRVFLFSNRANYEEFSKNCEAYSVAAGGAPERVASEPQPSIQR